MNRGVILKSFRETWPTTALFCVGFFAAELALGYVLPRFQEQFSQQLLQLPFVAGFVRALVGADVAADIGPEMFRALAWVHPVPLAITWAHAIVYCTRIPAGEVDRGTIDVLLGLPVSRWSVHTSDTLVWLAGSVWFFIAGIAGNLCGGALAGAPIALPRTVVAATNLWALYLAIGGIARLFSAWSDRRGRAVGVAFLFVAASFLFNYLTQFWPAIERLGFLSLLYYHRPIAVFRQGRVPLGDIGVLLAVAITAWVAAGWSFARRDLTTT